MHVRALVDRRRLDSARRVLGEALPQYPDSVQLLRFAAWVDWMDDQLDDALATIERLLSIDPQDYDARYLLARIRDEQERFPEAELVIIELLREYPEVPELYALYASIMLQTFHVEKAERLAREALRRDPDNESALNVYALCGFISAPEEEQRERLRKLIEEHPDQVQTTIRMIQLLSDQGRNH